MTKLRRLFAPGFTLAELMVTLVILGILIAMGAAKMTDNIRRSKEGVTQGNLGIIRSALGIYYADIQAQYPASLDSLTVEGRYIKDFPKATAPDYHAASLAVSAGDTGSVLNDGGGWAYVNDHTDTYFGRVWVNCTHTDSKGSLWSTY